MGFCTCLPENAWVGDDELASGPEMTGMTFMGHLSQSVSSQQSLDTLLSPVGTYKQFAGHKPTIIWGHPGFLTDCLLFLRLPVTWNVCR